MNKQDFNENYEDFIKGNPFQSEIDRIARDIKDRQDSAMAMEFTYKIGQMLRENGVVPHISEYTLGTETEYNPVKRRFICNQKSKFVFDRLDFTEHDKSFKDEIAQLKHDLEEAEKEIEELESELSVKDNLLKIKNGLRRSIRLSELTPIKAADLIIENFKQGIYPIYEKDSKGNIKHIDVDGEKYTVETGMHRYYEEVRQIAEHLLVYCNQNSGGI